MPGPQLTSLSLALARSLPARAQAARAPSRTCPGLTLLPRPWPGAHLLGSGFRRSSSLAVECGAAATAAAAAFAATAAAAAASEALPGAPPGLEAGSPREPGRRGPGARRGRTAGSCRREARGSSHPRPSSHNFAARVGALSGAEGGEDRARARGREGLRSRRDWTLKEGSERARGQMSTRPAWCAAGECVRARGVYSTLPSAAPAYLWGSPRFLPVTTTAAAAPGPDAPRERARGGGWIGRAAVAEAVPRARASDPYLKPRLASAGPPALPSLAPARPAPTAPGRRSASPARASRRRGGASGRTAPGGPGSARRVRLELTEDPAPDPPPPLPWLGDKKNEQKKLMELEKQYK
ncbi:unnamed protein product [Rangifer tarandus platyrhynchus]|uniref:Uncharacterized protein n=1 Tax=Rangifer tarandus platyrhynchus TaxID=3082113 RepID=A0ABN8ZGF9_RANTA|nr:unnamed protein product [Rangifer tarandus platyrhynchus]